MEKSVDPILSLEAPRAERPAPSEAGPSGASLASAPCFSDYAAELLESQTVWRQLQETTATGRRLTHVFNAQLHRGDAAGIKETAELLAGLQGPRTSMGEPLWDDPTKRLQLCDSGNVGAFVEAYMACLALRSFLDAGVLTIDVPDIWQMGIEDQDDERYLLALLHTTRELERYAVNRGQALDLRSINLCLGVARCFEEALMQFDFRNSELRRRFDGIKYCVKKLDNLAYEVDLALQRAAAAAGSVGAPQVVEPAEAVATVDSDEKGPCVIDLERIAAIKERYDSFDAKRELVIKRSRDVIKSAKNAVYALQRTDYKKADADLAFCGREASSIFHDLVSSSPSLRGGLFSASLEEMAEALAYRAFRKSKCIISLGELQETSGLSFPVALHEYLGGLMDLTGEVGRLAIRTARGGRRAMPELQLHLVCVDTIYSGMQTLPCLPMGLGKKMGPLRGTLAKIEGALYELALLSHAGLRVSAPVDTDANPEEEGA